MLSLCVLTPLSSVSAKPKTAQENVLFYPAYGIRDGADWKVELRLWVYEERAFAQVIAGTLASSFGEITDAQKDVFKKRSRHFLADSETLERIELTFENDPQDEVWSLKDTEGKVITSDANGNIVGVLRLSEARAKELLAAQKSERGWLTI